MALVASLRDDHSLSQYFLQVDMLDKWFRDSYLNLNASKTKELIFDTRKSKGSFKPIVIDQVAIETVSSFKYLGTFIDDKLNFNTNTDFIYKKAQQRLFLLRKLKSFSVSSKVLEAVYRSLIESILSFNIVSWFGNLSVKNKTRLSRVVSQAGKIVGKQQIQLSELYSVALRRKSARILHDRSHPLSYCFEYLPSGRRLKIPLARKNMFKRSFIPSAVTILNSSI